jgi:cytochrome c oxidase cbb3-type subunit 3
MSREPREVPEYPQEELLPRDGIAEEDARLPAWYTWSFIGTMVFALVYVPYYALSGWSSEGQWAAEVERAEARYAEVRESLPDTNPYHGDAAAIQEGAEVFATICAACHKPDGTGLVGPSLVDPYWKYGNSDAELFASVSEGRPQGMPPWGSQLGSEKIWKVLAYVETLPRSDEPGVGAPGSGATGASGTGS